MTDARTQERRYAVLCFDEDPKSLASLSAQLRRICGNCAEVTSCVRIDDAELKIAELWQQRVMVPLVVSSSLELLASMHAMSRFRTSRKVLLDEGRTETAGRAAVHAMLPRLAGEEILRECVRRQVTTFILRHAPEDVERFGDLIDAVQLRRAFVESRRSRGALAMQIKALRRGFLTTTDMSDRDAEQAMIRGLERALSNPPRQVLKAGTVLLKEDERIEGFWLILDGIVQLSRRAQSHEMVFDSTSAGPIVGLLALAQRRHAFFTARAETDVTAIFVTWEQFDEAMRSDPSLAVHFVTVLVRSLILRLRHVVDLQLEVETLNTALKTERDQLARTLLRLEQAQTRLIESEKMATLGQLAAKVAHELNNPIAAIHRAADYIAEDAAVLLGGLPDIETINMVIRTALSETPLSTRELRDRREILVRATGDEDLSRRLLKVGITTLQEYQSALGRLPAGERDRRLVVMERAYQLGTSLRNLRTSSERVTSIIRSLKSYARSDQDPVANVNIHVGLEDTLRLVGPALHGIEVVRRFGDVPQIECRVGELNQVWTNLISNALEAMNGKGRLTLQTDAPDPEHVRVRISDTGPGIAAENLSRVFDLNFTTKRGQAQFGLGMGLVICRQIVTRHGGTITLESQPGQTCFTVTLPTRYPRIPEA